MIDTQNTKSQWSLSQHLIYFIFTVSIKHNHLNQICKKKQNMQISVGEISPFKLHHHFNILAEKIKVKHINRPNTFMK